MKIRSKLTKLEQTVTKEQWEKIVARGDGRKYEILSHDVKRIQPKDVKNADYNRLLKHATAAFKAKEYEKAKELYEQLASIKSTPMIEGKLKEITELLNQKED